MKKLIYPFLLVLLVVAVGAGYYYHHVTSFRYAQKQERAEGPFFKLDVKLDYKGKSHDISFVVACYARITNYADKSTTREVGMTPYLYGHRMDDGQAVVVRAPRACSGETTENKWVPETFMPLIIVYEDATTLAFGRAYWGDDAYASPISELKFHSATITAATRADFDQFVKTAPKNVVTRERLFSPDGVKENARKGVTKTNLPTMGTSCSIADRWIMSEEKSAYLRKLPSYRPGESWIENNYENIRGWFSTPGHFTNETDDMKSEHPGGGRDYNYGLMRTNRDTQIGNPQFRHLKKREALSTKYPVIQLLDTDILTLEETAFKNSLLAKNAFVSANVIIRPELRGFGYCQGSNYKFEGVKMWESGGKNLSAENGNLISNYIGNNYTNGISYFHGDVYYISAGGGEIRVHGGDVL